MKRFKKNIREIFHFGFLREKLVRGNYVEGCGDSLKNEVTSISPTAAAIIFSLIICLGLINSHNVNTVGKKPKYF